MRLPFLAALLPCFVGIGFGGCGLGSQDLEVTIVAPTALTDAVVATVRSLEIDAGSGTHGASMTYPLTRPLKRSETVVIHVTSAHGALAVGVIAHDAAGGVVALGRDSAMLDQSGVKKLTIPLDVPAGADGQILHVTPPRYTLFTGQSMTLTSDSDARWSVQQGDAGGTIDSGGRYTAPTTAGSFTIIATSTAYFGHSATATVDVLASGLAPYVGALGGGGFRDGAFGVGRLAQVHNAATDGKTIYFTTQDKLVRAADIASGALTTLAGVLDQPAPTDGVGAAAHFGDPLGIVSDGIGNLYVADGSNGAIRKVVIATGAVTTFAGKLGMPGFADGAPGTAQFGFPYGLVTDGAGTLYVADIGNCNIRKVDIATQQVTTIAGSASGGGPMQCFDMDGTGASARLSNPATMAWDGAGHLYVMDGGSNLRRVDVASGAVSTVTKQHGGYLAWDGHSAWVLQGDLTRIDPDGTATVVKDPKNPGNPFFFPSTDAMVVAPDGTFYVFTDDALVRFDPTTTQQTLVAGVPSTTGIPSVFGDRAQTRLFGLNTFTLGQDGMLYGKAFDTFFKLDPTTGQTTRLFNDPTISSCCQSMITDGAGNLYGTTYDQAVRRISISDGTSSAVAGNVGVSGYVEGSGSSAAFNTPGDIVLDGAGNAYVADSGNHVIRKIVLASNQVSLFAGTPNMGGGYKDGTGPAAQFTYPRGLVYDGAGALYVADSGNNRIRKVTVPGAIVTTLSGSGMFGATDGPAATATFYSPQALTFDASKQNLYVADWLNNLVRKVVVATGAVSTVAGTVGLSVNQVGALPGVLNQPTALRVLPSGDLLVLTNREDSIVQIRLP